MKIEKKHIIIAIVVAVAVYFIWRRKKQAADETVSVGNETVKEDAVERVISASGMTTTDAAYVRQLRTKIEASPTWMERIQKKALERGLSYEQMLVLDSIWVKYYDNVTSDFKEGTDATTKSYVWKVQSNIMNM